MMRRRPTWALFAAILAAGCAGLLGSRAGEPGNDGSPAAAGDSLAAPDTVARADTAAGPGAGRAAGASGNAGPADAPPEDSVSRAPSGPVYVTDVEKLAAMGPAYTPYDRPPLLQKGGYLEGILRATVLPVVEKHDLPADTWARFWVLVDVEGGVRDAVLHLTSGHAAFDEAARAAVLRLRFSPARRDGEIVPVWVLRRVSLLMG